MDRRLAIVLCIALSFCAERAEAQPGPTSEPPPITTLESRGLFRALSPGLEVLDALGSPDVATRLHAARMLRALGPSDLVTDLLHARLLSERTEAVRDELVETLVLRAPLAWDEGLPPPRDLFDATRIGPASVALYGADAIPGLLPYLDHASAATVLREALQRANLSVHPALLGRLHEAPSRELVELLGAIGDPVAVPSLLMVIPQVRDDDLLFATVLRALRDIGDPRALPAVRAAMGDGRPGVQDAAQGALLALARAEDVPLVERIAEGSFGERRQTALATLLALDPTRGAERLVALVTSGSEADVRLGTRVALAHPTDAGVPVLYGILQEGTYADEAVSALALLPGQRGAAVLLREIERPEAQRGLAVALRRGDVGARFARRAREALAALEVPPQARSRLLVLRALAGDDAVLPALLGMLADAELPVDRAWAAMAAGWLGGGRDELVAALDRDDQPEVVLRAIASALLMFAERPPVPARFFRSDGLLPDALAWRARDEPSSRLAARDRRQLFHRHLSHPAPRVRAAAASALATIGAREAWRVLRELVLDDEDPQVRRAAAWALARLGVPRPERRRFLALSRLLDDPSLRAPLRAVGEGRPLAPPTGRRVLRFRVAVPGYAGGVPVSVALPDGRSWELLSLPTGEVVLPGLPAGDANVQVALP